MSASKTVKILGLCGSLRAQSFNKSALLYAQKGRSAAIDRSRIIIACSLVLIPCVLCGCVVTRKSVAPKNAVITLYEGWGDIPAYNQDLEAKQPESVSKLKSALDASDAVMFAVPEYNYGFPGGLKNAIDAASRPYGKNSWAGKPAGIMSASIGMLGGARAQYQLRQMLVFLQMPVMNGAEV